jgi:hypothetical protein
MDDVVSIFDITSTTTIDKDLHYHGFEVVSGITHYVPGAFGYTPHIYTPVVTENGYDFIRRNKYGATFAIYGRYAVRVRQARKVDVA